MPIGLGFRVVPSQAHTMNASFRFSKGAFELALADGRHAQFTRIDNFGLAIERSDPGLTMPRCWTFLGIELYDAETFPELGRVNADGSALTANLVDVGDYLARAMSVLIDAWPACIPDIVTVFRAVIALDAPSGRVFSASSDKAPFVMQLTIRENEWRVVLAEMIVHESAHLKLHLLTTLDPLVVDNGERRFTHPWRTDLRPITGVLFGAHAFLNVLVMYEHAAYNGVEPKFAANEARLRRAEVHDALATLGRNARFTSAGAELYTDMCRVAGFEP